jgi:hypothetical protein
MISIIVCSINPVLLLQLQENIISTVGVEYEILAWDNNKDNKGICEVYNSMAKKARFEYLCFIHEDILFQTPNWGHKLHSIFKSDPSVGAIGLAGNKYKSAFFSGWYTGIPDLDCSNIVHVSGNHQNHILLNPDPTATLAKVVCLDGVFICCRKKIWQKTFFDEMNLRGFHFYDIDFSVKVASISTVIVTYEILVEHITSGGDFGNNWVRTAIQYHLRNPGKLPLSVIPMNNCNYDSKIIKTWFDVLKNYKIAFGLKCKWIAKQKLFFKPGYYYSMLKFFLYRPLRLKYIHRKSRRE